MIEISTSLPLTNVLKENPDTIWIKGKASKKPKEGKDYLLCYNYKGIRKNKDFYTPVSEFSMKPFALLAVK